MTRAGPSLALEKIQRKSGPTTVYNFTVEEFHTYFVGVPGSQLWVHNATNCTKQRGPNDPAPPPGCSDGHWTDLGWDPDQGKWDYDEAATAWDLEQYTGPLSRIDNHPTKHGDWIDANGKSYDGCSPAPSEYFDGNFAGFNASLKEHLSSPYIDFVVVDITRLGLTPAQLVRLEQLLYEWGLKYPGKIIRLP